VDVPNRSQFSRKAPTTLRLSDSLLSLPFRPRVNAAAFRDALLLRIGSFSPLAGSLSNTVSCPLSIDACLIFYRPCCIH
jgi:hypothetical protein